MALLHNGKYKRISRLDVNFTGAGFINAMLEVYNNEQHREKTKSGEEYKVRDFENVCLDNTAFDTAETYDIRNNIYKKIKNKEEYQGSTDI